MPEREWGIKFEVPRFIRAGSFDAANATKDRIAARLQRAIREVPGFSEAVVEAGPAEEMD